MSVLVIEWDRDRLIAVSGMPSGSGIAVQHALTVPREVEQTPEALGAVLRQALAAGGISSESATIVLPRALVTLSRIQLPNVGDNELPEMVRLQAATRLTVPLESVCMDYVPLPGQGQGQGDGRDVLLATAPAKQIAGIRRTMEVAGLTLEGVHVSSFAIASALAYAGKLTTTGASVETVLTLRQELIELLMIRQQAVVFSHSGASWSTTDRIEQAVRSEISRGRMAATEAIGQHVIQQVTLIGSEDVTSAVPDEITKRLDNSLIQRLDPADSIIKGELKHDLTASDVLAAAGVIISLHRKSLPAVDLVNPRKPLEKADNRRLKVILTAGAVVLLCVAAWKWRDSTISELQKRTKEVRSEVSALKKDYKDGEDDMEKDAAIQAWAQSNVDWLEEMNRIREVMGGTDRLLIRNFTFSAGQGKTRGTITADCYARDRRDVQNFYRRLEAAGYDVVPKGIEAGSRDPAYSTEFSLVLTLPMNHEES